MRNPDGDVFAWYNVWRTNKRRNAYRVADYLGQLGISCTMQRVEKETLILIPWTHDAGHIQAQLIEYLNLSGGKDDNSSNLG